MRILFVVANPPSLVRVRPYNLIRGLAARGHEIITAVHCLNDKEWEDVARLRADGMQVLAAPVSKVRIAANLLAAFAAGLPLQAGYSHCPNLERALAACLDRSAAAGRPIDIVHVEHLRGARYGVSLKQDYGRDLPVVWDSVDSISYLFEQAAAYSRDPRSRLIAGLELDRTRRYEGWLVGQFDRVLATSPLDAQALEQVADRHAHSASVGVAAYRDDVEGRPRGEMYLVPSLPGRVAVLPNGVDLDYFVPDGTVREPATVLFSGKMSYHANVTAAQHLLNDIMPHVWRVRPGFRVVIAGKDPPSALMRLARSHPNVVVTGTVPDLRPYLRSATVAVSPLLYGAGIQNKVLEAMACATPVVASPRAVAALSISDGEQALLAAGPEAFARRILAVASDPILAGCLGAAGRAYVERRHDWAAIVSHLEALYLRAIDDNRRRD